MLDQQLGCFHNTPTGSYHKGRFTIVVYMIGIGSLLQGQLDKIWLILVCQKVQNRVLIWFSSRRGASFKQLANDVVMPTKSRRFQCCEVTAYIKIGMRNQQLCNLQTAQFNSPYKWRLTIIVRRIAIKTLLQC